MWISEVSEPLDLGQNFLRNGIRRRAKLDSDTNFPRELERNEERKKERKENPLDAWRTRNPCPRENIDVLSDLID
jgi:hypothetical protein